jgi:type I restriction enzyme S subunit
MSQISPKGWAVTQIQSIAAWGSGGTPSRKNSSYYGGKIPWIKTGDLGNRMVTAASEFLTEDAVKNSSAKWFRKGSVIMAMYGATIGRTSILGLDATTNQACAVGNPIENITSTEFLYYLLCSEKDSFIAKGKGGAQPNISQALIKAHEISLPPLAEQKEIVAQLDKVLAQVESTTTRLDAIPATLKKFRQSVLVDAVNGKLTESFLKKEISMNIRKLGDICEAAFDGPFGSKLKTSDYTTEGVRVARLENIGHLNFIEDKRTYISEEKYESLLKNRIKKNDVLFSSFVDEEVRVCIFPIEDIKFINKADCFCLRPNITIVNPMYIVYLLASRVSYDQIKSNVQGVTRPRINLRILKSLEFRIPPLSEQTEIVRRVEELFAYADKVEAQVNAAQERVNKLTQSILAKAFSGELTAKWRAQNPDLITGENSAAALLEKIKAERAGLTAKKKPAKKTTARKAKA